MKNGWTKVEPARLRHGLLLLGSGRRPSRAPRLDAYPSPVMVRCSRLRISAARRRSAMASFVRLGGMLAFFVVMAADRIGRKPVISITVLFYTLFTLLTALSRSLTTFTIFQSGAQVFLSAEFGVAGKVVKGDDA